MKVETYEVEEINSSEAAVMAADSEAMDLVAKLGLFGQIRLQNTTTGTRLPYRKMTALEFLVFSLHCPITTKLEDYSSGIIPLRVLQVAAHCKEQGFFDRMVIMHSEDVRIDPVLVGQKFRDGREWNAEPFLLARWGAVWKEFPVLVEEAKAIWTAKAKAKISSVIREAQSDLAMLNEYAEEAFTTGSTKNFTY